MRNYLHLARPHHWIKNALVLLPLLCSGQIGNWEKLQCGLWAFLAFSLLASAIYCINDIRDRDRDARNPSKCHRPIAAGTIRVRSALCFCGILLFLAVVCGYFSSGHNIRGWACLGAYFLLNLGYSLGLKDVPMVDIAILVSGFLLRMLLGGAVTDTPLSRWLCLTVISGSFYMGLGKRRGELLGGKSEGRKVLQYYSEPFLRHNMTMTVGLTVVFYAMWTMDALTVSRVGGDGLIWTVPLVILIFMKYGLNIEAGSDGDPVEVLLHDKWLLGLGAILAAIICGIIYL